MKSSAAGDSESSADIISPHSAACRCRENTQEDEEEKEEDEDEDEEEERLRKGHRLTKKMQSHVSQESIRKPLSIIQP